MNATQPLSGLLLSLLIGASIACEPVDPMMGNGDTGADTASGDTLTDGTVVSPESPTDHDQMGGAPDTQPPVDCMDPNAPDCGGLDSGMMPCDDALNVCLDAAGEDAALVDACFYAVDSCYYDSECLDPATGVDGCMGDGRSPCDAQLELCLTDAGEDAALVDACFYAVDSCYYDSECLDPMTGEDWCAGDWIVPAEPECSVLFDDCLALGVSAGTCELVFDECTVAQQPPEVAYCDLQLADCIYAGLDMNFCMAGYDQCVNSPTPTEPPVSLPGEPTPGAPPMGGGSADEVCMMGFEQCLNDGRSEAACKVELLDCAGPV